MRVGGCILGRHSNHSNQRLGVAGLSSVKVTASILTIVYYIKCSLLQSQSQLVGPKSILKCITVCTAILLGGN
jgi:hypothetical protein